MSSLTKTLMTAGALLLAAVFVAQPSAQAPSNEPSGPIIGSGNFFSPIVSNLETAVTFYRDGLGLDVTGAPANAEANPALRNMFGLPDGQIRWSIARPPAMRTGTEIVEIRKPAGKRVDRRMQDPGAFTLIVLVRDVDAAFARVRQLGAPVVTAGGAPMTVGARNTRAVIVKDPDGHFVEIAQLDPLPPTSAPESANVVGVRVRLTVEDAERAMRLYWDLLGIRGVAPGLFSSDKSVLDMLGMKGGQYRVSTGQVPTTGLRIEFVDFKGVDRKSVRSAIQDPGSTRMQLQVRDLGEAIRILTREGGTVVSTGGAGVELPGRQGSPLTRAAIVRDPNNLFVVLIQPPPRPQLQQ